MELYYFWTKENDMKIAIAKVSKEVNSTYKPSIIESDFLEVRL